MKKKVIIFSILVACLWGGYSQLSPESKSFFSWLFYQDKVFEPIYEDGFDFGTRGYSVTIPLNNKFEGRYVLSAVSGIAMGKRQRMENTVSPEFDGVLRVSIRQPERLIDSVNVPIRIGKVRYKNEKSTDVPQYSFILPFKVYKKDLSMTVTVLQPCSHTDISKFNKIKIAMTASWY